MSKIAYNTPVALHLVNQVKFLEPIWEEIIAEVDGGDDQELIDAMHQFCSPKWALEKHQEWLEETAAFDKRVREGLTAEEYSDLWSQYEKLDDHHHALAMAAWSLYRRFVLYIVS
jgi:hypothetical protein